MYPTAQQARHRALALMRTFIIGLLMANAGVADEAGDRLLHQLLQNWKYLQGRQFTVAVDGKYQGQEYKNATMRLTVGLQKTERHLAPFSFEELRKNPGEPHLSEQLLTASAFMFDGDKQYGEYRRVLISSPSPGYRPSELTIRPDNACPFNLDVVFFQPFTQTVDGLSSFHEFGNIDSKISLVEASVQGEQPYAGVIAKVLRIVPRKAKVQTSIELLVGTTPTPLILGLKSVDAPNDISKYMRDRFQGMTIHQAAERAGVLVPIDYTYQGGSRVIDGEMIGETRLRCELVSATRLNEGFVGLWTFRTPSGTKVHGLDRRVSMIPFTDVEERLIREYLIDNNQPIPSSQPMVRHFIMAINALLLLIVVSVFAFRRKSRKQA